MLQQQVTFEFFSTYDNKAIELEFNVSSNDKIVCTGRTNFAGQYTCTFEEALSKVDILLKDARFVETELKDQSINGNLAQIKITAVLALKVQLSEKIQGIIVQVGTFPRTTDSNGAAFLYLFSPIQNKFALKIYDSNNRYYTQNVEVTLTGDEITNRQAERTYTLKKQKYIEIIVKKNDAEGLNDISINVLSDQTTVYQSGNTDPTGKVIFYVAEDDTKFVDGQQMIIVAYDQTNVYQSVKQIASIADGQLNAVIVLSQRIKVNVQLKDKNNASANMGNIQFIYHHGKEQNEATTDDNGVAVIPQDPFVQIKQGDTFSVELQYNQKIYKAQKCQEIQIAQISTQYECNLDQAIQYELNLIVKNVDDCSDKIDITVINKEYIIFAGHPTMIANQCQYQIRQYEGTGKLNINQEYIIGVYIENYDLFHKRIVFTNPLNVDIDMIKNPDAKYLQYLVLSNNVYSQPISGLFVEATLQTPDQKEASLYAYSNSQGMLYIKESTDIKFLNNKTITLKYKDSRIQTQQQIVYILFSKQTVTLPTYGGIMFKIQPALTPFDVFVSCENNFNKGQIIDQTWTYFLNDQSKTCSQFTLTVQDPGKLYASITEQVELDSTKKLLFERTMEKQYVIYGLVTDSVTQKPISNIDVKIQEKIGDYNRTIDVLTTNENGIFIRTSTEQQYVTGQTLYFDYIDNSQIYQTVSNSIKISFTSLNKIEANASMQKFIEIIIQTQVQIEGKELQQTQSIVFLKFNNSETIYEISTNYEGLGVASQINCLDIKPNTLITLAIDQNQYLETITQQITTNTTSSVYTVTIIAKQKAVSPLQIQLYVFDKSFALPVEAITVSLVGKQSAILTTCLSDASGLCILQYDVYDVSESYSFEVKGNNKFSDYIIPTVLTQANSKKTYIAIPYGAILCNVLGKSELDVEYGVPGMTVQINSSQDILRTGMSDMNGKIAVYLTEQQASQKLTILFNVTDPSGTFKNQVQTFTKTEDQKTLDQQVTLEKADLVTVNHIVKDSAFNQPLKYIIGTASTQLISVKKVSDESGLLSFSASDSLFKFKVGGKVNITINEKKFKPFSLLDEVITDVDFKGAEIKLVPNFACRVQVNDDINKKIIYSDNMMSLIFCNNMKYVPMPMTKTKSGEAIYYAEDGRYDLTQKMSCTVQVNDLDNVYSEYSATFDLDAGISVIDKIVYMTKPPQPLKFQLSENQLNQKLNQINVILKVGETSLQGTTDIEGKVNFNDKSLIPQAKYTLQINNDQFVAISKEDVVLDNETEIHQITLEPFAALQMSFVKPDKTSPVVGVTASTTCGDNTIQLGQSNAQGIIISYLTQICAQQNEIKVKYQTVSFMNGEQTITIAGNKKIIQQIVLAENFFIKVLVLDSQNKPLKGINITAKILETKALIFDDVQTNQDGICLVVSPQQQYQTGQTIEIEIDDPTDVYKRKFESVVTKDSFIDISTKVENNYIFDISIVFEDLTATPDVKLFTKINNEVVSINTTDASGKIRIISEFLPLLTEGTNIVFAIADERYISAQATVVIKLIQFAYQVQIKTAKVKQVKLTFKVNNCIDALKSVNMILFSQQQIIEKGIMENCQVEFKLNENIAGQGKNVEYNAFAYGYKHNAGTVYCNGQDQTVQLTMEAASVQQTLLLKAESLGYQLSVEGTLTVGPCNLTGKSSLIGQLIFTSSDTCKLYQQADGILYLSSKEQQFDQLKQRITIDSIVTVNPTPYMTVQLWFFDESGTTHLQDNLVVTISTLDKQQITQATTFDGKVVRFIPQSYIKPQDNKYLITYSNPELHYSSGEFIVSQNTSTDKIIFGQQTVTKIFTLTVKTVDSLQQQKVGLTVSISNNEKQLCQGQTTQNGYECKVNDKSVKLGQDISIKISDNTNFWSEQTIKEKIPINQFQQTYTIKLFAQVTLNLKLVDENNQIITGMQVLLKNKNGETLANGQTNNLGIFSNSWNNGIINVYEEITAVISASGNYPQQSYQIKINQKIVDFTQTIVQYKDHKINVQLAMKNCQESIIKLIDSNNNILETVTTKVCDNSITSKQLVIGNNYKLLVSSVGYEQGSQDFLFSTEGQIVKVEMKQQNQAGLGIGAIVGISIGAVVGVVGIVLLVWLLIRKPVMNAKKLQEELEMPLLNE